MKYKIEYTPYALEDLQDIRNYIARKLKVPESARRIDNEIREAINSLERFPFRYQEIQIVNIPNNIEVRSFTIHDYRIFYQINSSKSLAILRIIYGGRDINKAFSEIDWDNL